MYQNGGLHGKVYYLKCYICQVEFLLDRDSIVDCR